MHKIFVFSNTFFSFGYTIVMRANYETNNSFPKLLKNRLLSDRKITYRICFLIVCGISLFLHFRINDEYFNIREFGFFTVQSNIFCFIVMTILIIKELTGHDTTKHVFIYFKGMATAAILCTGYVYHFAESINIYSIEDTGIIGIPAMDLFAHYIVPLMFVLDWILFQKKGLFRRHYVVTWMAFPVFYFICFLTRCWCNGKEAFLRVPKFPYNFMDYETLGTWTFLKYIGLIVSFMFVMNTIIYVVDYMIARRRE